MSAWNELKENARTYEKDIIDVVLKQKDRPEKGDGLNFHIEPPHRDEFSQGDEVLVVIEASNDEDGSAPYCILTLLWEGANGTVICLLPRSANAAPRINEWYEYPEESSITLSSQDIGLNRIYAIFTPDPLPDAVGCALGELAADFERRTDGSPVPVDLLDQFADAVGPNACIFRKSFRVK